MFLESILSSIYKTASLILVVLVRSRWQMFSIKCEVNLYREPLLSITDKGLIGSFLIAIAD
jgi:hypothetical protein